MTQNHRYEVKYNTESPDIVESTLIDPIDYHYAGKRDVDITIRQPEFTSVCPMTGLPDFGKITITYRPNTKIVELKSLKFYLMQYRNVGIYYEHVVNRILDDLVAALSPKFMDVTGDFTSRGGIDTTVRATFGEK